MTDAQAEAAWFLQRYPQIGGDMTQRLHVLAVWALSSGLLGCSPYESRLSETGATLEGEVKYGAEKVPMALVVVVGPKGQATGQIEEGGRYKVENAPLGEVNIGVNTDAMKGQMISQQMASSYKGPGKGGSRAPAPRFVAVPAKYWEPETSGVTTTIDRKSTRLNSSHGYQTRMPSSA